MVMSTTRSLFRRLCLARTARASLPLMILALPVCAGVALAGTIRADLADSSYRNLAAQSPFAPVGEFLWTENGSSVVASGTLINSQWVLTAAHVTAGVNSSNIGTMTFSIGGQTYYAAKTLSNTGWTGDINNGNDVGLVKLDRSITSITPATLYTGVAENRQIGTIVGYGSTGTGLTGVVDQRGRHQTCRHQRPGPRQRLNSIPWTGGGSDNMLVADFDAPQPGLPATQPSISPSLPTWNTAPRRATAAVAGLLAIAARISLRA